MVPGVVGAPAGLAEDGVAVEGDLSVEGHDPAVAGAHERVDLDEQGVLADEDVPQPDEDVDRLRRQSGRLGDTGRRRRRDPSAGSTGTRATASGRVAATSSMSMPPSAEAIARKRPAARSRT
ncbi:hypothetical protein SHKM778_35290 [Streptomyces sp. KM77-8]|uniref:Uncharacterized protein n=1 Tax=Streptomyces haneummycinicus TaxID=3074435 RepID=A0AAT9HIA3_9ACTN